MTATLNGYLYEAACAVHEAYAALAQAVLEKRDTAPFRHDFAQACKDLDAAAKGNCVLAFHALVEAGNDDE